ncbi:hypothetical protein Tco_0403534 [Tanacetum coccineum]
MKMWIVSRGGVLLRLLMLGIGYLEIADKIRELLEYKDVHDNDASECSQPSWGKIGEVVYSTSLSMVCVKYSAYVRRVVADFSHVPPNEYSPRPNDK